MPKPFDSLYNCIDGVTEAQTIQAAIVPHMN